MSSHEIEKREGGGGIMNTTHISTVRMLSQSEVAAPSCKEPVGKVGPGRNKSVSERALAAGNSYVPSTPPLRERRHTNRSSNKVPHAKHPTVPRSTGGRPLPVGVSCSTPTAVLPKLEFGARVTRSSGTSAPRTASLARVLRCSREEYGLISQSRD